MTKASGSLSLSNRPTEVPLTQPIVMTHPAHYPQAHPGSQSGTVASTHMTTIYPSPTAPLNAPISNTITPSTLQTTLAGERRSWEGQAVVFLHAFAGKLSACKKSADRSFWNDFVRECFTTQSSVSIGLSHSETHTTECFVIQHALLPKFFHTQYKSGIESIQLVLQTGLESALPNGIHVEYSQANMIHRYDNGVMVILEGHLHVKCTFDTQARQGSNGTSHGLKIDSFQFSCNTHQEFVERSCVPANLLTTLPASPVNHWGISPRLYEQLKLLRVPPAFNEIVRESIMTGATARECLQKRKMYAKNAASPLPTQQLNPHPYQLQQHMFQLQINQQLHLQRQYQSQLQKGLQLSDQEGRPAGLAWQYPNNLYSNAYMGATRPVSYPIPFPAASPLPAYSHPMATYTGKHVKTESPATSRITSTTPMPS